MGGVSQFAGNTVGGAARLAGDGLGAVGLESTGNAPFLPFYLPLALLPLFCVVLFCW